MPAETEIIFIGTGAGSVSLKRNHSSFIIRTKDNNLLIDAGEGISHSLISAGIEINDIDAILITHFHPDHLNGISLLLNQMKMFKRTKLLRIFIHENLAVSFQNFIETNYIFLQRLVFECIIEKYKTNIKFRIDNNIEFLPKENSHLKNLIGFQSADKIISCSFLFNVFGYRIYYSGDLGDSNDLYLFNSEIIDIFISESTHITVNEILEASRNLNLNKIILTHIADDLEDEIKSSLEKLPKIMENKIIISYDGMSYKIGL